jgi:hypothetical protein
VHRFRDVSKDLFQSIAQYAWNGQAERLGLDEVGVGSLFRSIAEGNCFDDARRRCIRNISTRSNSMRAMHHAETTRLPAVRANVDR